MSLSLDKAAQSAPGSTLEVNFRWNKFKALVSEKDSESNTSTPKYIVNYNSFKSPHLVFHHYEDTSTTIGSGTLHPVTIHADYELHGQKGTIKALKRFITSYTHLSYNYSDNPDGTPAAMTWTSTSSFKTWDFVCLDRQQTPVAKFSANTWALSKIGNIEFLGSKAHDLACREEILITGLTLCYQMMLRATNILNLAGAFFSKPGPLDMEAAPKTPRSDQDKDFDVQQEVTAVDTKQLKN